MMPAPDHNKNRARSISLAICALVIAVLVIPGHAAAQSVTGTVTSAATGVVTSAATSLLGGGSSGSGSSGGSSDSSNAVPVADVLNNPNQNFLKLKGNTLDSLAYGLAQVVLHQVTSSVVNWINSGFNGNPSFLTNPTSFFLNSADQITGAFLAANGGPLSNLCSPFALDIRLSLALGEAGQNGSGGSGGGSQNYSCTLGTIIQNAQNASVGVSVGSSVSGTSDTASGLNGFMNGDFSQGGWTAFMAMTTEPQNNVYGAYYEAGSDLQSQIQAKQASINSDLDRGNGFLSWQSCSDISQTNGGSSVGLNTQQVAQLNSTGSATGSDGTQYSTRTDPSTGAVVYQTCTVQTPGSVIHDSLQQSLGSSVSNLVSIHDFNEIVNALFSQLLTQVLNNGLNAASNGPSGGQTAGIITQIENDQDSAQVAADQQQLAGDIGSSLSVGLQAVQLEQQAVDTLTAVQSLYQADLDCFNNALNATTSAGVLTASSTGLAMEAVSSITNTLTAIVDPAIAQYQAKADAASSSLSTLENIQTQGQNAQSLSDINTAASAFNQLEGSSGLPSQSDVQNAETDLANAQTAAGSMDADAQSYQNSCIAVTTK